MSLRIGMPRALLYYKFYPLWRTFFRKLGATVIVSHRTGKKILYNGIKYAPEEVCLPVKVFYGHVLDLRERVDYIFIPRIASVERKSFVCAKFWGLPDVIKNSLDEIPPILTTDIDLNRRTLARSMYQLGRLLIHNPLKIRAAYKKAKKVQKEFLQLSWQAQSPMEFLAGLEGRKKKARREDSYKIGLIGRSYNTYDDYINLDIIKKLEEAGASLITIDMFPPEVINREARNLSQENYWTYGKDMLGAASYLTKRGVDGLIFLTSFNCGPDSLLVDLAIRKLNNTIPMISLIFDEEMGETGLVTRLESFLEMIKRDRRK